MLRMSSMVSCGLLFKDLNIMPLPCLYFFEIVTFYNVNVETFSKKIFTRNCDIYKTVHTRHGQNLTTFTYNEVLRDKSQIEGNNIL